MNTVVEGFVERHQWSFFFFLKKTLLYYKQIIKLKTSSLTKKTQ